MFLGSISFNLAITTLKHDQNKVYKLTPSHLLRKHSYNFFPFTANFKQQKSPLAIFNRWMNPPSTMELIFYFLSQHSLKPAKSWLLPSFFKNMFLGSINFNLAIATLEHDQNKIYKLTPSHLSYNFQLSMLGKYKICFQNGI